MKAHGSNMGINTAIHDVIVRLCYRHRTELKHAFLQKDWMVEG